MSIFDQILNAQFIEAVAPSLADWHLHHRVGYQEQIKLLLKRITGPILLGNELKFAVDELKQKIDETVGQQGWKMATIT